MKPLPPKKPVKQIRQAGFTAVIRHSDHPPVIDIEVDLHGEQIAFSDTVPIVRDYLAAHLQQHLTLNELQQLADQLTIAGNHLQYAIASVSRPPVTPVTFSLKASPNMAAKDILANLTATVARTTTVMGSATELITGFAGRLETAIQAALANGATEEELAPVTAEAAALTAGADALAAATAANTVAAPEVPPAPPLDPNV